MPPRPLLPVVSGKGLAALEPGAPARADEKADALLREVAATTRATRTLRADLEITAQMPGANPSPVRSTGSVMLMKPNYARVVLKDGPYAQTLAATGTTLFTLQQNQYRDRVYGYAPACEVLTRPQKDLHLLEPPLTETDAVCIDPAVYAYAAVRDARVCLGDNVIVFGLGAIGLLAVQMPHRARCLTIIAVDPIEKRRDMARGFGAHLALAPRECDVAIVVHERLGGHGADIAIEASGSYKALHSAIRSVRQCARVLTLGSYHGRDTELEFGKEWFHNRLEMICSLPCWGNPPRDAPVWTEQRLYDAVTEMFRRRVLDSQSLIDPVVDFADSARAFREVFEDPAQAIKLGIRFPPR